MAVKAKDIFGEHTSFTTPTPGRKTLPEVISEITTIKFDVLGRSYVKNTPSDAIAIAESLLKTTKVANVKFTEMVLCRTTIIQADINTILEASMNLANTHNIVIQQNNPRLRHEQHMCYMKGPLSAKEFIQLMQFKEGDSNSFWTLHIQNQRKSKL